MIEGDEYILQQQHEDITPTLSLSEILLYKPQPPTPTTNDTDGDSFCGNDELFYRLEKENARLPPQDSTEFILAQIERQNALLEKDPKSIYIHSNELKAHFSTVQRLVKENIDEEEEEEIDWGFWEAVIKDSDQVALKLPHLLSLKLRSGIPSKVRGLMWQAISKSASLHLETLYEQQLVKEKSPHERIIQRDLARTFPRIDMFKQENGQGQSSMKRVLEAYSLYDTEVGYCQGMGFLVGPLLMNMPETQSFCVFVRLMDTYEMRSMFTLNMEGLQLRLYQFSSLLTEILPQLSQHLSDFGVHAAMYASQWFLTLFAYVFPIELVARIYDIVFAEGAAETIMRVAISMLKRSQEAILAFDEFEDILDFVTTKKLCEPYTDNYSAVVRDAMALSDIITRDKIDHLSAQHDASDMDQQQIAAATAGRFGFWKKSKKKKLDMKRSASTGGTTDLPPLILKKRWSSVSSRKDWSYKDVASNELERLKEEHQKTLNELLEVKYDKQDLECEKDALKMTITELERSIRVRHRSFSTDTTARRHQPPIFLKRAATTKTCDHMEEEGTRSFSDLAVADKADDLMLSRQNSVHHSMLSTSSFTTTTEYNDDELSLSQTTTIVPIDDEELSSQLVHLKVKNYELEQHVDKLNQDVELITSKFDMVNEGQMVLVDKLVTVKSEMDELLIESKKKDEAIELASLENQQLKQELEILKQNLTQCRLENVVLYQDLENLKATQGESPLKQLHLDSNSKRIRRHSTTSSSMSTLVKNKRMEELEHALTATKIKLAQYESPITQKNNLKKKPSIYGRVLHAIKYNNNA